MRRTEQVKDPARQLSAVPLAHDPLHRDCKKLVVAGHRPNQLSCVHPLLAAAFLAVSDALPKNHRLRLVALAPRLVDTASIDPLAADALLRRLLERALFIVLPMWRTQLQRELRVLDKRPGRQRSHRETRREQRVIQHAITSIALVAKDPETELFALLNGLLSMVPD